MNEPADPLGAEEVRVLGVLIEKQVTTPDYYPLTLNALTHGCNQTSNRDPVMALDEGAVRRALERLRERRLAALFSGADSRVAKYSHRVTEAFGLTAAELAALCELMLRGPQTVGEIRGRAARMHPFASLAETEEVLAGLAARTPEALAIRLPRQTGFKEPRYAQLLGGVPGPEATGPEERLPTGPASPGGESERLAKLEAETARLRQEVAELREQFAVFRRQFE